MYMSVSKLFIALKACNPLTMGLEDQFDFN